MLGVLLFACATIAEWNISDSDYACTNTKCNYEILVENLTSTDLSVRVTTTFSEYIPGASRRVKGKESKTVTIPANSSLVVKGSVDVPEKPNSFKVDIKKAKN